MAEAPAGDATPEWGAPPGGKEKAGPKGWRGVGQRQEDWGELNTGKMAPCLFVLDTAAGACAVNRPLGGPPVTAGCRIMDL